MRTVSRTRLAVVVIALTSAGACSEEPAPDAYGEPLTPTDELCGGIVTREELAPFITEVDTLVMSDSGTLLDTPPNCALRESDGEYRFKLLVAVNGPSGFTDLMAKSPDAIVVDDTAAVTFDEGRGIEVVTGVGHPDWHLLLQIHGDEPPTDEQMRTAIGLATTLADRTAIADGPSTTVGG